MAYCEHHGTQHANTRGWKPLTIITKRSILDVEAVLDPPLNTFTSGLKS